MASDFFGGFLIGYILANVSLHNPSQNGPISLTPCRRECCHHFCKLVRWSKMSSMRTVLFLLPLCCHLLQGDHFMGAVFRFKTDPSIPNTATFYWKAGYVLGSGPCGRPCPESMVGQLAYGGGNILCHVGCTDNTAILASSDYWVTIVSEADEYETGENEFTHTFESEGPFKVGIAGSAWRSLDGAGSRGEWRVFTTVKFGVRSDTNRPNNSPVTTTFPLFKLQFDCDGKLRLPLVDPDGDTVRCRWGDTWEECGSVCNGLPGAIIDEETCTLEMVEGNVHSDGWYVVAIVLEDFPTSAITMGATSYTTSDALSLVPVQFLVRTLAYSTGCDVIPEFVEPTAAAESVYYSATSHSVAIIMFAANYNSDASIVSFDVAGPSGVTPSPLYDDETREGVRYMVAFWTPTAAQSGTNTICFIATDSEGKSSEYRCVYVFANDEDECEGSPCGTGEICNNLENMYTCVCPTGTSGVNCTQDTYDSCTDGYCASHATCIDGSNTFTCLCPVGYTDVFCSTNINECSSDPCINGGTCIDEIGQYTCLCIPGYEGLHCQYLTDECKRQPCQHSSTCLDLFNDFYCICSPGYSGRLCDTDINECSSSPCINGGTCTDIVNGYTCACTDDWTGVNCQLNVDDCMSKPCKNNGICIDMVGSYYCVCDVMSGFYGTNCDIDIDECASSPCFNGGHCIDGIAGFACNCTVGWSGPLCEYNINECHSSPCLHGGSCYDGIGSYSCTCTEGYTGLNCDVDINECESSPCVYGNCTDEVAQVSCKCEPGYEGVACDCNINECESSPCENKGGCTDLINSYNCTCHPGYAGEHCETDFNECVSNPCVNSGTCIDALNGYTCLCMDGFTGTECETNIDDCLSAPCANNGTCTDLLLGYICQCQQHWYGERCTNTDIELCTCQDKVEWSGARVQIQCQCADDFTFSSKSISFLLSAPCRRNMYVVLISVIAGVILACLPLSIIYLVQDLRRRYQMLLNRDDPDSVDKGRKPSRWSSKVGSISFDPPPVEIHSPTPNLMKEYLQSQGYGAEAIEK